MRRDIGPAAEKEGLQSLIQVIIFALFALIIIVPALELRLSSIEAPTYMIILGNLIVLVGFAIRFLVFRENSFTATAITVEEDQVVVSTGPYALIRHPMYLSVLIVLLGTPIALGSWWSLLIFLPLALAIAWRSVEEERFLMKALRGYEEYSRAVPFRLLPYVW